MIFGEYVSPNQVGLYFSGAITGLCASIAVWYPYIRRIKTRADIESDREHELAHSTSLKARLEFLEDKATALEIQIGALQERIRLEEEKLSNAKLEIVNLTSDLYTANVRAESYRKRAEETRIENISTLELLLSEYKLNHPA